MGRSKGDPEQAKLRKRLRDQRRLADPVTAERKREKDRLYQQKKREQARLHAHQDALAQLATTATQEQYLQDVAEVSVLSKPREEQEPIDVGITVEEDGEILENQTQSQQEQDRGFYDDAPFDFYKGFDSGFQDTGPLLDCDGNSNEPLSNDDGEFSDESQSLGGEGDTDDEFYYEPTRTINHDLFDKPEPDTGGEST